MKKYIPSFLAITAVLAIIAVVVFLKVTQLKELGAAKQVVPPEAVSTTQVKSEVWQQTLTSVGSLTAVQGVTVAAELDGKITQINFLAGATVNAVPETSVVNW